MQIIGVVHFPHYNYAAYLEHNRHCGRRNMHPMCALSCHARRSCISAELWKQRQPPTPGVLGVCHRQDCRHVFILTEMTGGTGGEKQSSHGKSYVPRRSR